MWTPTTRRRYSRDDLRYETDLTDAEWALIEPLLPEPLGQGRPRVWPRREIMNAIFYVLRGGIAWRLLPSDLPPTFRTGMARLSCFACRGARFRSSRRHSPTWALPGTGLRTRPRSPLRSSGSRPIRSGLPCIRAGGWSSGSSRGSAETGGFGRTRKRPSPQPKPSSMPLPSCSSSADWPDPHDFRDGLLDAATARPAPRVRAAQHLRGGSLGISRLRSQVGRSRCGVVV